MLVNAQIALMKVLGELMCDKQQFQFILNVVKYIKKCIYADIVLSPLSDTILILQMQFERIEHKPWLHEPFQFAATSIIISF